MIKKLKLRDSEHMILITAFALITALTMYFKCDDFILYYAIKEPELEYAVMPNGRYLTNALNIAVLRHPILRCFFITAVLTSVIMLMGNLINFRKDRRKTACLFSLLMLIMIPKDTYAETINWISGFTNYALSALLSFIYIYFSYKIVFRNYTPRKYSCVPIFILAFAGGFCLETVSIYNIAFAVFILILTKRIRKKFFGTNIAYLTGAVSSFVIMMLNGNYNSVAGGYDIAGNRKIDFSLNELYYRAFKLLVPNYCRDFWFANIVIAVSVIYIYLKTGKNFKYGKLCSGIITSYAAYSIYSACFEPFQFFTQNMTVRAFECAFAFAYILSIAYFLIKIPDRGISVRCLTYLVSTLVVTLPFLVVSPMTPRCMFHNYLFWILLSGELFMYAFKRSSVLNSKASETLFLVLPLTVCVMICSMNISDYHYNKIRFDYLREQIESNSRALKIIQIPYLQMEDDLKSDNLFEKSPNLTYIFKYHNIPVVDLEDYEITFISPIDYNI
jgi:putative membrane protein